MFRCSIDGKRIGQEIGKSIAAFNNIESAHFIGHSCGSFVVLGLCEGFKGAKVQTTYLDPVSIYGGVFQNYGVEHFGECADFSDAWIDTEDNIKGSNQLLPNTHTFDITEKRKNSDYQGSPHNWLPVFYQTMVIKGEHPQYYKDVTLNQQFPSNTLNRMK